MIDSEVRHALPYSGDHGIIFEHAFGYAVAEDVIEGEKQRCAEKGRNSSDKAARARIATKAHEIEATENERPAAYSA